MAAKAVLSVCLAVPLLAQSGPDMPQAVSAAVVAVGVITVDAADSSGAVTEHPAFMSGSGFFVNRQGDVVTAAHVVRATERTHEQIQGAETRLFVGLRADNSFIPVPAQVVGIDDAHDLAVLRTKLPARLQPANPVKLSSARPADGALIETVGLPASTGLALVHNTGHLADTVLLRSGNLIAKAPANLGRL